jgi:hypothetical protein
VVPAKACIHRFGAGVCHPFAIAVKPFFGASEDAFLGYSANSFHVDSQLGRVVVRSPHLHYVTDQTGMRKGQEPGELAFHHVVASADAYPAG